MRLINILQAFTTYELINFRASAEAEGNDLSNNDYAITPTYSAAAELFTQFFMMRRVRYLPRPRLGPL